MYMNIYIYTYICTYVDVGVDVRKAHGLQFGATLVESWATLGIVAHCFELLGFPRKNPVATETLSSWGQIFLHAGHAAAPFPAGIAREAGEPAKTKGSASKLPRA